MKLQSHCTGFAVPLHHTSPSTTAVRNLVRAGVSQKVAMELTGHLTPSVFDRYNITDDRDRRDAVAKLAAAAQDKQVLAIESKRSARV